MGLAAGDKSGLRGLVATEGNVVGSVPLLERRFGSQANHPRSLRARAMNLGVHRKSPRGILCAVVGAVHGKMM